MSLEAKRVSRREALRMATAAGAVSAFGVPLAALAERPSEDRDPGVLDELLVRVAGTHPEYSGSLSNHGSMVAEALVTLGRDADVMAWYDDYKSQRKFDPPPARHEPIAAAHWRAALGDGRRMGDWIAHFDRLLEEASWQSVTREWTAHLAPGLITSAAHGALRTAHAVRALSVVDTPERRHELAQGFGYWAARYRPLPANARAPAGRLAPSEAILQLQRMSSAEQARPARNLIERLSWLEEYEAFAPAIDMVDATGDPDRFLSDLAGTFAAVYEANATDFGSAIGFVHAITGPCAVRLMLPYVAPETRPPLLRRAWQTAAAFYVTAGNKPPAFGHAAEPPPSADELIERAVASKRAHAIKCTEACLREHAASPNPALLRVAALATEHLQQR